MLTLTEKIAKQISEELKNLGYYTLVEKYSDESGFFVKVIGREIKA